MAVMEKLKIFVVKEPVVAASCLIAGFGRTPCRELPLCAGSGEGYQWQALPSPVQCEETATRTRDLPVIGGLFLPAVVRPILDSWETAEKVPPPPLNDVVAGVTGKKK
ncbi:uncharacterized protein [Miscanthus floridulus]|uniref:uncharacterized protein n=1 Tax=Miscanthus floridulus TaxID=154761 RepID=UPI00345772D0